MQNSEEGWYTIPAPPLPLIGIQLTDALLWDTLQDIEISLFRINIYSKFCAVKPYLTVVTNHPKKTQL